MTDQDSGDEGTLSLEQPKELCLHSLDGSGDIAQPGEAVTPGPECQPESNPAAGDERDVVAGQATEAVADVGGMNEGPNRPGAGDGPTGSSPQWVAALADVPAIGDPGRQREVVPVPGALTVGVPDTELDFWSMGPFELRACSSRGMSHRYAGVPRQDSFCVGSDNEWVVFAVADGVSQGCYSQVAAETAARAACKLVLEAAASAADGRGLDDFDWSLMCGRISRRILDEAKFRRLVTLPDDSVPAEQAKLVRQVMSTTAVVGAVSVSTPDAGVYTVWLATLAGDSGAYKLSDGRICPAVGGKAEDGSGITETAVRALPGAADPTVVKCQIRLGEAVLLTSDGLGDPIGHGDGEIGTALAERWAQPPSALQILQDINFLRRTFDDDRTAVGVWVVDRNTAN